MPTLPLAIGIEVNIFVLLGIGLAVGILTGFAGVGGGFVLTPALIIIGFPANYAVGTSLAWIVGNSIIGVFRHQRLGNVDVKLGLLLAIGTMGGVELGARVFGKAEATGIANEVVLTISVSVLLGVGVYTLWESIKKKRQLDHASRRTQPSPTPASAIGLPRKLGGLNIPPVIYMEKSGISISLWNIFILGFVVGILVGLIGVGGGFLMVPALVYLIGLSSFMAVGTSLFQVIFSATYGTARHFMNGNVLILPAFVMLATSSLGVHFGAQATRYVQGISIRLILGIVVVIFAIGSAIKFIEILLVEPQPVVQTGATTITFGGLGITVLLIILLLVMGRRYQSGRYVPTWIKSFVAKGD